MRGRLLHHDERRVPPRTVTGDPRLVRVISEHVERQIGPIGPVLHDLLSDVVHVDLLWVQPGPHGDFHTIVTCGMSQQPMPAPEEAADCRYAELLIRLPASWRLDPSGMNDPNSLWPMEELAHLARMPHWYDTWLWAGHTVTNGEPPVPFCPSTQFSGSILMPPAWTRPEFETVQVDLRRRVQFFSVLPLYREELLLARDAEVGLLPDWIERAGVTDLLDLDRPSLIGEPN